MATEWYYQAMGAEVGPVSSSELAAQARAGQVTPDTLVRRGKDTRWVLAQKVQGLFDAGPTLPTATATVKAPPVSLPPIASSLNCASQVPPPVPRLEKRLRLIPAIAIGLCIVSVSAGIVLALAWIANKERVKPVAESKKIVPEQKSVKVAPVDPVPESPKEEPIKEIPVVAPAPDDTDVDEATARDAVEDAIAAYDYGDHQLAFDLLDKAAGRVKSDAIQRSLLRKKDILKKASEDAYIELGPVAIKRIKTIQEILERNGIRISAHPRFREELTWAFTGPARPYLLMHLRKAQEDDRDNVIKELSEMVGPFSTDQKIALRLLYGAQDLFKMHSIGKRLIARDTMYDVELQAAADNPYLKKLYVEYMKAGGADDAKGAAERAKEAAAKKLIAECDDLKKTIANLELRITNAQTKIDNINQSTIVGKSATKEALKQEIEMEIKDLRERIATYRMGIRFKQEQLEALRKK